MGLGYLTPQTVGDFFAMDLVLAVFGLLAWLLGGRHFYSSLQYYKKHRWNFALKPPPAFGGQTKSPFVGDYISGLWLFCNFFVFLLFSVVAVCLLLLVTYSYFRSVG